jgi:hypothetical protein
MHLPMYLFYVWARLDRMHFWRLVKPIIDQINVRPVISQHWHPLFRWWKHTVVLMWISQHDIHYFSAYWLWFKKNIHASVEINYFWNAYSYIPRHDEKTRCYAIESKFRSILTTPVNDKQIIKDIMISSHQEGTLPVCFFRQQRRHITSMEQHSIMLKISNQRNFNRLNWQRLQL